MADIVTGSGRCRLCGDQLTATEKRGVCRECRHAARNAGGYPPFCEVCGQPIWGHRERGRTCSRPCAETMRHIMQTERLKLDYEDLPETCRDELLTRARPATIEDIIEAKLRRDHGDGPVVIPELCPDGECWAR